MIEAIVTPALVTIAWLAVGAAFLAAGSKRNEKKQGSAEKLQKLRQKSSRETGLSPELMLRIAVGLGLVVWPAVAAYALQSWIQRRLGKRAAQ